MTTPTAYRYTPRGLALLEPKAFGLDFLIAAPCGPTTYGDGKVAVVNVCGPLCFSGFLFDTYDAIRGRVRAALASDAECVLLMLDTPGGDVAGCFDCARGLRDDAKSAGKRLVAWVPNQACSAGYALASVCDEIVIASTAGVGSVGAIHELVSLAKADAAAGVQYAFVRSGAKKALGGPHMPLDDATIEETQRRVDQAAELFFGLVSEGRGDRAWGELQAAVFMGAEAVARGLADRVSTLDALVASLVQPAACTESPAPGAIQGVSATSAASSKDPMAAEDKKDDKKDEDSTRAALVKDSMSDDAAKSTRAKKALAAYDEKEDDKAQAKASDDDKKEPPKEDDKAIAASVQTAAYRDAAATYEPRLKALEAQIQDRAARDEKTERDAFMTSVAHLPEAYRKNLEALPIASARALVASLPPAFQPQAIAPEAGAVRGVSQSGDFASEKAAFLASPMAARMRASQTELGVTVDPAGTLQTFGVQKVKA